MFCARKNTTCTCKTFDLFWKLHFISIYWIKKKSNRKLSKYVEKKSDKSKRNESRRKPKKNRNRNKNKWNERFSKIIRKLWSNVYLHATFTLSVLAYADAALGRCVTNANSPKYWPFPNTEISTSPDSCSIRIETVPSSMKYIPSAASPEWNVSKEKR